MCDHAMWQVNLERHQEWLRIAANDRLTKVEARRVARKERLVVNVGQMLVNVGTRLKTRYEPALQ